MYKWSLCTGGPCVQVVLVYRWFLCTGGSCVQAGLKIGFQCTHFVCGCVHTYNAYVSVALHSVAIGNVSPTLKFLGYHTLWHVQTPACVPILLISQFTYVHRTTVSPHSSAHFCSG